MNSSKVEKKKVKRLTDDVNDLRQRLLSKDSHFDDKTYKNLCKRLRYQSEYEEALNFLNRGIRRFPNSIALHVEMFNLYSSQGKWEKARSVAEILISIQPDNGKHYYRLGRSYNYLKYYEKASYYLGKAIDKHLQTNIEEIIEIIKNDIDQDVESIKSKYIFLGGKNNLGAIEHEKFNLGNVENYITKIVYINKKREENFYLNICERFPQLKNITPSVVSIREFNNIGFITMEKISGTKPEVCHLGIIVESTLRNVSSIRYGNKLLDSFNAPNYNLILNKKRGQSVVYFFSEIHNKAMNNRLFILLKNQLAASYHSPGAIILFHRLEMIIFGLKIFDKIDPKSDYSLLHGDLGHHNILIESKTNKPYLLDWNSYTVGPKWFDIVNLAVRFQLPFQDINEKILNHIDTRNMNLKIGKILFIYAYIIVSFQSLSRKKFDASGKKNFNPVLKQLEVLALSVSSPIEKEDYSRLKAKKQHLLFYMIIKYSISWCLHLFFYKLKKTMSKF